ncbi:unnamed protein product [Prorocentrum cordatum]|uniref:Uncharacterized protein n=1 Tax=Prorocentrum cordatum TaxID=2364126 RepID=A0ABN9XLN6_9DINO|nr:unnamed protein product [Polarella glacialis]
MVPRGEGGLRDRGGEDEQRQLVHGGAADQHHLFREPHRGETVDGVANELHGAPSRPDTAPPPPAWFLPSSGGVRACERADRRGGRGGGKAAD